jgi:transaldolase
MPTKLDQLKAMSVIVADTGDLEAIRVLAPVDCTTNPSLILKAAKHSSADAIINEALAWAQQHSTDRQSQTALAAKRLTILFGQRAVQLVTGRVSTEVDARLSFDCEATIVEARAMIAAFAALGIGRERILVKIAATWEGISAARVLEAEGINCNLTLIFSLAQAHAAADAGAFLISPFVGRITDWHMAQLKPAEQLQTDPGVDFVCAVYAGLKVRGSKTIIMGASFRTTAQIEALAGCDRLTIAPNLIEQLGQEDGRLTRKLWLPDHAGAVAKPIHEADFSAIMAADPMASLKLRDGIDTFIADTVALEKLLAERFSEKHPNSNQL